MSENLLNALNEELAIINKELEETMNTLRMTRKRKNRISKMINKLKGEQ